MIDHVTQQSQRNAAVETEEYNLVSILKPRIFLDGNQWCVLYGENLQEGIAGFGDTPYQAVLDFNRSWVKPVQYGNEAVAQ